MLYYTIDSRSQCHMYLSPSVGEWLDTSCRAVLSLIRSSVHDHTTLYGGDYHINVSCMLQFVEIKRRMSQ